MVEVEIGYRGFDHIHVLILYLFFFLPFHQNIYFKSLHDLSENKDTNVLKRSFNRSNCTDFLILMIKPAKLTCRMQELVRGKGVQSVMKDICSILHVFLETSS